MGSEGKPRFRSNWLTWTVERRNRSFRVYVVEPRVYEPTKHADIFWAALQSLLFGQPSQDVPTTSDLVGQSQDWSQEEPFDLLTFPEAFLASETLLEGIRSVAAQRIPIGCIHAGLRPRPDSDKDTHLFVVEEIQKFLGELKEISSIHKPDLEPFEAWLGAQNGKGNYNLGCLFATDSEGKIRICLHPKLVRSKYEESVLHRFNMTEANLLSLVTLKPTDKTLSLITIQPLICSDALSLPTSTQSNHPIPAITSNRNDLENELFADHVDIVSVATFSPTDRRTYAPIDENNTGTHEYEWKRRFRDAFSRAAGEDSCSRHHSASFILTNYGEFPVESAGLSGAFIPLPLYSDPFGYPWVSSNMAILGYFQSDPLKNSSNDEENERWTHATPGIKKQAARTGLGYIVALDPRAHLKGATATMFGFTFSHLPRDANRWQRSGGITDIRLLSTIPSRASSYASLEFVVRDQP